jgi:hypothetical protein
MQLFTLLGGSSAGDTVVYAPEKCLKLLTGKRTELMTVADCYTFSLLVGIAFCYGSTRDHWSTEGSLEGVERKLSTLQTDFWFCCQWTEA